MKFKNPTVVTGISHLIPGGGVLARVLAVAALLGVASPGPLRAQPAPGQPDPLMSLMMTAPRLAVNLPVAPEAKFDPPVIAPGGQATYRVSLHTLDEAITRWPEKISAPPQLKLTRGAQGMIFRMGGGTMEPLTVVNFHVTATDSGVYVIPAYEVEIYGRPVTIPAARLQVQAGNPSLPSVRKLLLEPAATNVYVGQSVRIRVLSPAGEDRVVPMMAQVQLNGDGFITGKSDISQQISMAHPAGGHDVLAFIYDTSITPFSRGPLKLTAQGFTAGNMVSGQITIQGGVTIPGGPPEYMLLESEPIILQVNPLPARGRLPGFNGAIGKFTRDLPQLSTNTVVVGTPIQLKVTFHGNANVAHLAMPADPATPAWQSFSAGSPVNNGNTVTFTYTLVPQTEQTAATPEIPFSYFDPDSGQYADLSIPAMAVKVLPGPVAPELTNEPVSATQVSAPEKKLSLSPLSPVMGKAATSLVPLQERNWFYAVELVPLLGLYLLWLVSRHRQFLEQHPDIMRRRRARRDLHREWRKLRRAAQTSDATGFAASAVQAIRLACAPHFPAEPRALVCGDILQVLPETERTGENGRVVSQVFRATDALDFAVAGSEVGDLLKLQPQLDRLLTQLEARL